MNIFVRKTNFLLSALAFMTACRPNVPVTEVIRLNGSNTIGEHLMPQCARAFLEQEGAVVTQFSAERIEALRRDTLFRIVIQPNGSKAGLDDLKNGRTDFAMISESQLATLWPGDTLRLGTDEIAIVAHRHNPVAMLDTAQVYNIFTGKTRQWADLAPNYPGTIHVHVRDSNSGTFGLFRRVALRNQPYATNAQLHASNIGLFDDLRRDYYGIGYMSVSELTDASICKIIPVANGVHFERPLLLFFDADRQSAFGKRFAQFCRSGNARDLVRNLRFGN